MRTSREGSTEGVFMVSGEKVHLCLKKKKQKKRKHLEKFPKGPGVHYCV